MKNNLKYLRFEEIAMLILTLVALALDTTLCILKFSKNDIVLGFVWWGCATVMLICLAFDCKILMRRIKWRKLIESLEKGEDENEDKKDKK